MSKTKKIVSFILCMAMIFAMSVTSYAAYSIDDGISPQADIEYYINANNVNLRSGAGTEFSSGGQVNYGDILTLRSVYDSKQNKTTFVHYDSNDAKWYSVHMVFGNCRGLNGYVFATYVSSRTVDRIEY